jgi:hypothetical protein
VLFILAGRLAVEVEGRRIAAAALAAACVWYVAGTALLHPHYLAHFNELAGGPSEGYHWLAESNLDWGQDLKGLKRYMDERDIDHIRLGYFGSGDADYYGISYDYLPSIGLPPKRAGEKWWYELDPEQARPLDLAPGLVAVSANLVVAPGWIGERFGSIYEPLRELEPIDSVGYSILIYDIP